jgi:long-subunit acyl-CoA synthetase (AMP-forming)
VLKSDLLISGYDEDPKLTAEGFKDGWYYTRDLGHLDAEETC